MNAKNVKTKKMPKIVGAFLIAATICSASLGNAALVTYDYVSSLISTKVTVDIANPDTFSGIVDENKIVYYAMKAPSAGLDLNSDKDDVAFKTITFVNGKITKWELGLEDKARAYSGDGFIYSYRLTPTYGYDEVANEANGYPYACIDSDSNGWTRQPTSPVPVPAGVWLLGTGLVGLLGLKRPAREKMAKALGMSKKTFG